MKTNNSYAIVDLDALRENFQNIQKKAGVPVMAIIKADAYGHGAVPVARCLSEYCTFFGVATLAEAVELRTAGITQPIMLLGPTHRDGYATAVRLGIRPTVFCYEDGLALSKTAEELGVDAPFHIAVDTGMSRIGFQVTPEDADVCEKICRLPRLVAEGLFSHFATADSEDLTRTEKQAAQFAQFDEMLRQRGVAVKIRHLDNSAGIMNYGHHYEMVRSGIITYGLYPSDEVDPKKLPLKPVLSWHSRITHVKTLEPCREIGYGGTYVTTKPTVVATVPVGYADGYKRTLSNRFYVLIRGKKAPVLGRVCMDQMMVDVTEIPGACVDDDVVLIGRDADQVISMEEIGATAQSFNYEFACSIGRRVPRYYLEKGKITEAVNYLTDNRA